MSTPVIARAGARNGWCCEQILIHNDEKRQTTHPSSYSLFDGMCVRRNSHLIVESTFTNCVTPLGPEKSPNLLQTNGIRLIPSR